MNNEHIDKLKAYGINPADYDEFEMEEIADTLNTYEENKAQADSYLKELEAGEESDNGYHEFLQGMADREIISLYENYGIVTNIKIEGWEPASRYGRWALTFYNHEQYINRKRRHRPNQAGMA